MYLSYDRVEAQDPFHTEARALVHAMRYAATEGNEGLFMCFSDNINLVNAIKNGSIEDLPSWKAAEIVQEGINLKKSYPAKLDVKHVTREAVRTPHIMANWARKTGQSERGTPIQCCIGHMEIEHSINKKNFEIHTSPVG